jgi:hypothetical protein
MRVATETEKHHPPGHVLISVADVLLRAWTKAPTFIVLCLVMLMTVAQLYILQPTKTEMYCVQILHL